MEKDFGNEISKLAPLFMREITRRDDGVFSKGECVPSHLVVLDITIRKGECTMKEIASTLALSMGAVTAIIDRMINLKLVSRKRDINDRRVVNVFALKKGHDFYSKLCASRVKVLNEMFAVLTDKEKWEYIRILTKVINNAKN